MTDISWWRLLRIDTGDILISDVTQANQCLVLAEMKGCQVTDWIVGKAGIRFHKFYTACV